MSPWMHLVEWVLLQDRLGKTKEQTRTAFKADNLRSTDGKAKENKTIS